MTQRYCQGKPAARAIPARHAKILPALAPIRVPASSAHSAVDATAAVIAAVSGDALDAPTDVPIVPNAVATVIVAEIAAAIAAVDASSRAADPVRLPGITVGPLPLARLHCFPKCAKP